MDIAHYYLLQSFNSLTLVFDVPLIYYAIIFIIQGTEFYDAKTKRYVDFPITDILQMMGRAGRPQYDQHGKAVILVHEPKKSFYKKVMHKLMYMNICASNFPVLYLVIDESFGLCSFSMSHFLLRVV